MKSEITEIKKEEEFPKLIIGEHSGVIILVTNKNTHYVGTVVYKGNSVFNIGHYSETWDKSAFTDFNGTLTLSND